MSDTDMSDTDHIETTHTDPSDVRRVVLASATGSAIEWYDFFLFGTAAALVFPQLFFPNHDPVTGTLASFGAFAAGFLARPVGAVVAGHLGDRVGRKKMLIMTVSVMGVASTLIGLLPTYSSVGIWAPILLVVLRMAQGFGVGGEIPGAQIMCVEYAPPGKRGIMASWPIATAGIGLGVASGLLALLQGFLTDEQFMAWGWRIPFLLSIFLVFIGLAIRFKVLETPVFRQVLERMEQEKVPLVRLFTEYPLQTIRAIGMYSSLTATYYVVTVLLVSFATKQVGLDSIAVLWTIVLIQPVAVIASVAGGWLSDKVGRRPVFIGFTLATAIAAWPAFYLIELGNVWGLFLGGSLLTGTLFLFAGVQGSYFSELFPPRMRYTGVAVTSTLATVLAGSITPSLGTILVARMDGASYGISIFIGILALVAAVSAYFSPETYRRPIDEESYSTSR